MSAVPLCLVVGTLTLGVAEVGVVEDLENVLGDRLGVLLVVIPSPHDTLDRVLDNDLGNLTSGLVEQKGKVVLGNVSRLSQRVSYLGEERMRWVRRVPVVPNLVLVVRVNDGLRRGLQGVGGIANEGLDERLHRRDDEDGHRVADLLGQGAETGNAVDSVLLR